MKHHILFICFIISVLYHPEAISQAITFGTLLEEMADIKRLAELPNHPYRYIQFSSYDRRSTNVSEPGWFANSDGFGKAPVPGFERVLKAPDKNGIGEYLICEINGPGAILRLWTARMYGNIRLFLDQDDSALYDGPAQDLIWKTMEQFSAGPLQMNYMTTFRQSDATYFPIPFARSCRIEWIGDIKRTHFYHVGIRVYEPECEVKTFCPEEIPGFLPQLKKANSRLAGMGGEMEQNTQKIKRFEHTIPENSRKELIELNGSGVIEYLSLKLSAESLDKALRQNILNIYFDGSPVPQVQSPVGDFFGAAPGINPYNSVPFLVHEDGTMECRFYMPFKDSVRIEIENISGQGVRVSGGIRIAGYTWKEGKSMHFRARWRINHRMTASNVHVTDIPYLMAFGVGRIVGTTSFLLNPSNAPMNNGNWWGEGDEKIFVDRDTSPALFGTGSEDYYNYSWSSSAIFSFPYSGQPRNDGPGNRGFVTNYRWHILDDIPFNDRLAFYMELLHHGEVPGFAYGRTVYLYALPGMLDDHVEVSADDVREQSLPEWSPVAYKGSEGYQFINAEVLISPRTGIELEEGALWADGEILVWTPAQRGEQITFSLYHPVPASYQMVITLAHMPEGGKIIVWINGKEVKFNNETVIDLHEPHHRVLRNHRSETVSWNQGENRVIIKYVGEASNEKIGIDFFWVRE